jgi:hypothetical protein
MQKPQITRVGAMCAIAGAILLFIGTLLHPMQADPNEPAAAFAEYAVDHFWVTSHLMQLTGVTLMVVALLSLREQLKTGKGSSIARLGLASAIASLALAAVLQAVDGVALHNMVQAWSAAVAPQKEWIFSAAFAVRQIEIGLASMFCIFMGLTAILFGVALLKDGRYAKWFCGLAVVGGLLTSAAGIAMAYTGFSDVTMAINMPGNMILLLWMLILGVLMWRSTTEEMQ